MGRSYGGQMQGPAEIPSMDFLFVAIAVILVAARLAGEVAQKIGLPSVVGESLLGMLLGLFPFFGSAFQEQPIIQFISELGAILLLFEVGLGSTFSELRKVSGSGGRVAVIGMLAPLAIGVGMSLAFGAATTTLGHLFIGAALTATSVGLTARTLRDLGQSQSLEAKIILAASVFDDILGLLLLAVLSALAESGGQDVSMAMLGIISAKALVFILFSAAVGKWVVPPLFRAAARFAGRGAQITFTLGLCFLFSGISHLFGLSPILGAFLAGLLLQPLHFEAFKAFSETPVEDQLEPLSTIFIPFFFVAVGMKVDLPSLMHPNTIVLGVFITLAAIVGKVVCGITAGPGADRMIVGVGMIPRGEVGIIFASMGTSIAIDGQPLISMPVFGSIIFMVMATSIISPIWLEYLIRRKSEMRKSEELK